MTVGLESLRQYVKNLRDHAAEYLNNVAAGLPRGTRVRVVAGDAERAVEGILDCARDQEADLIAMATHGRSGWARVAIGSVAESVLHKSTTPVLLIRSVTAPTSANPHSAQNEPAHFGG
jgi:nucleotide-binding universal stress UspA family protein